jgi:hypothetical protein
MRTILLDTNVLLADPGAIFAFPDSTIVIPETVLGELDKLKTSRVDPDLRFRGREVSRMLFELSEQGSLIDGVDLPDGDSVIKVVPYDSDSPLPEGLSARNADDRILATAYQVCAAGCDGGLTVVTNDLNMLLKAQALGLEVQRHGDGVEGSFGKRYIVRPFQRYKVPLAIMGISIATFMAILLVAFWVTSVGNGSNGTSVTQEFRDLLSPSQVAALDYLNRLEADETDAEALLGMGNLYFDLRDQTGSLQYSRLASSYYEKYLLIEGDNSDARTSLAASYFYSGRTDEAIQEVGVVLESDPDHLQGNFNLGIFYWRGRQDYAGAASQFRRTIELAAATNEPHSGIVAEQAAAALVQLEEEAEAAGQELPPEEETS